MTADLSYLDRMDRRAGGCVPRPERRMPPAVAEFAVIELARITAAIHALHRQVGADCLICGSVYPCRTVLALTGPRIGRAS